MEQVCVRVCVCVNVYVLYVCVYVCVTVWVYETSACGAPFPLTVRAPARRPSETREKNTFNSRDKRKKHSAHTSIAREKGNNLILI